MKKLKVIFIDNRGRKKGKAELEEAVALDLIKQKKAILSGSKKKAEKIMNAEEKKEKKKREKKEEKAENSV